MIKKILNKQIRVNGIGFFIASIIYIYISMFLFLILWVKPIYSIITIIAVSIAIYKYYKSYKKKIDGTEPIYVNIIILAIIGIFIVGLGVLYGWTGLFKQTTDWYKHNAVLADLTNKSWPVYYQNSGENSMLTYYIGQYIFPAFLGKITSSIIVAQIANGIWAMVGLFLTILGLFKITKANTKEKQLIVLIITVLFSTCMTLSQNIGKIIIPDKSFSNGHWFCYYEDYKLQLSSNVVLLRWVMPQCIVPWLTVCLIYDNYDNIENYVISCLPVLFYSTLTFIALLIILVVITIINTIKEKNVTMVLKKIFSLSNILTIMTLGIILLAYFSGNVFSTKPENLKFSFVHYGIDNILIYIIFIFSFIPYTILLFKTNKKNPIFWISTAILLILPFARMGLYNDLVMRTSIIPLFIYMVLCIKELFNKNIEKYVKIILILFLIIGSYSSINELKECFSLNDERVVISTTLEDTANRNSNDSEDVIYNYYSYDIYNNFFYKYLARKQLGEK